MRDQEQNCGLPQPGSFGIKPLSPASWSLVSVVFWSLVPLFPAVQERLQNQRCRNLVHHLPMVLPFVTGLVEDLVRLAGRQSFVPEINRQPRQFAKGAGKHLCFLRSLAAFARKMQRIADHNPDYPEAPGEPRQGPHVLARISLPCECEHRLGGQAEFVRHGYADALGTEVEAEKPWLWRRVQAR
jgi:hypothetical protein